MRSGLFRARALLLQILAALLALLPGLRLVVAEQGGRMHQWKPWMIVTVAEPLGLLAGPTACDLWALKFYKSCPF